MALLIKADGTREDITGEDNGKLSYKQVQKLTEADLVERVPCDPKTAEGHTCYYCDEEGKFKSRPINATATKMSTWTMPDDFMVGDILFVKDGEDMK